jgi:hypothetical protein
MRSTLTTAGALLAALALAGAAEAQVSGLGANADRRAADMANGDGPTNGRTNDFDDGFGDRMSGRTDEGRSVDYYRGQARAAHHALRGASGGWGGSSAARGYSDPENGGRD